MTHPGQEAPVALRQLDAVAGFERRDLGFVHRRPEPEAVFLLPERPCAAWQTGTIASLAAILRKRGSTP
jgi:hypothetical protein